MKAGGRVRFFVTLISILAATLVVGALVYNTTYQTLRSSYRDMLERNVEQGALLVQSYIDQQFALLSVYAASPGAREGDFTSMPPWPHRANGLTWRRLCLIDARGHGWTEDGRTIEVADRTYFQEALAGHANLSGPYTSRFDGRRTVVMALPVPGNNPRSAVIITSVDLSVLQNFLASLQGLSGAEFTLSEPGSQVLATTAGNQFLSGGGLLQTSKTFGVGDWTLSARVRVMDLLAPVRAVLYTVGGLVLAAVCLVVVIYLNRDRGRRLLDQVREDRTQALRDAYEQIRKLAFHDTVTRLPNRNLVLRRLGEALMARSDMAVLVVALGRFRSLSTTFGLHFGDLVLKETASRLSRRFPESSGAFVGRLGGSEFLILLPEAQYSSSTLPGLLDLFRAPMGKDDLSLHVNVHIGSCRLAEAGDTPEDVIKSAETALWAAREQGPHEACELDADSVAQRLRRAQLQKLLPEAWERGEMEVHYQPQVNREGEVAGYEALLRWTSPELGSVSPVDFIPVAEETGSIVPLGYWVLDQGLEFARTLWEEERPALVSVNVSAVQFLQHGFLEEVDRRVETSGLPHQWFGLEITESTLMEGIDQLRPALGNLMAKGVQVSLDDFGTGYSSLNYLKDLPLNTLKIDKSFIQAIEEEKAFRLVECIIDLAHHLGLIVVAEGMESDRQEELLRQVNCDLVQGFKTGRPEPARLHLDRVLR